MNNNNNNNNNNYAPKANRKKSRYDGNPVPCDLNNYRPSTPNQPTSPETVEFWSKKLAKQRENKK